MSSALNNLSSYDESSIPSAKALRFGIVLSEWHKDITHALYSGCYDTLLKHDAISDNIHTIQVPGAFELTAGARLLASQHKLDALICLGCVIKGETSHNEYINQAVAMGITNLSIALSIPVIFGVLTPDNEQQALDRAGGQYGNKGTEAAVTAIRMGALKKELSHAGKTIGFGR